MDLTRPVTYRGLTLTGAEGGPGGAQPIDGIRLSRARYTDVPVAAYTEKRSLGAGLDASDAYLGGRMMVLTGEVFGENKGTLFDRLDFMREVFSASSAFESNPDLKGYLPLEFSQPTNLTTHWPTGFIAKVLFVRPMTQNEHDIVFGAIGGKPTNGYVVPFTVALQAKDPFFHAVVDASELITGNGSEDFRNRGNAPSPLRIELHINDTAAGGFTLDNDRTEMTLTIPAGASPRHIVCDSAQKIVTLNGDLAMDLIEIETGTWPVVIPTDEEGPLDAHVWTTGATPLVAPSNLSWPELWY
jgi:hypothetical protein